MLGILNLLQTGIQKAMSSAHHVFIAIGNTDHECFEHFHIRVENVYFFLRREYSHPSLPISQRPQLAQVRLQAINVHQ